MNNYLLTNEKYKINYILNENHKSLIYNFLRNYISKLNNNEFEQLLIIKSFIKLI